MQYSLLCSLGILAALLVYHREDKAPETCETDAECIELCSRQEGRPCTDEDLFGPSDEEIAEECHPDDSTCWNERMGVYR